MALEHDRGNTVLEDWGHRHPACESRHQCTSAAIGDDECRSIGRCQRIDGNVSGTPPHDAVQDRNDLWRFGRVNGHCVSGLNANARARKYYEENGKFVRKILKWDILGRHKILPSKILFIPYNWITSMMRKQLKDQLTDTASITTKDFFLQKKDLDDCWDIYVVAEKV